MEKKGNSFVQKKENLRKRFLDIFRYSGGKYYHRNSYKTRNGEEVTFWDNCVPKEILDFIEEEIKEARIQAIREYAKWADDVCVYELHNEDSCERYIKETEMNNF